MMSAGLDSPPAAAPAARVLVVDDDHSIRTGVARMLRRRGCLVEVEPDARHAVAHLRDGDYDLVLSDVSMPHLTGHQLARAVRAQHPDVPVALMTGGGGIESIAEAVSCGVVAYLTKPFNEQALLNVLQRALAARQRSAREREALAVTVDQPSDAELDRAIAKLWMAYQPIVDVPARTTVAHEALVRSREPSLANPLALINAAERQGRMRELSRAIRGAVAEGAGRDTLTFVNLHASDLDDPELYDAARVLGPHAARIVFEVTERSSMKSMPRLREQVRRLKSLGYRVAIDDLGAGWAGLASLVECEPDFVKIDRGLVTDVHLAPAQRRVIGTVVRLCDDLGMEVIAEGVETAAERDALVGEGCRLMQGYLFGRPAAVVAGGTF